ncbi:MAG: ATP synthase F1 subunit gamma [Lachnospiraceae bacterium]|nr:ATP synthase F1 subunit gamma [Lachnospiraceae bacterium]MBQ3036117.1 ATP synthase F1 subunit gamma [Lachnospiraceae bacterium]
MASMRDIKRRKAGVQSTQQITKAMKLVSTVKLQRAKVRALQSKTYFSCMYDTVVSLLAKAGNLDVPYTQKQESPRKAIILLTSNRGLAGGYNSNVVKLITQGDFKKEELDIYAIGRKGREVMERRGYTIKADFSELADEFEYADAIKVCNQILKAYDDKEVGEIYLAYTNFKNTVSQTPTLLKLLPVLPEEHEIENDGLLMNFEPQDEEALKMIIPKYMTSLLHGALIEALASENGARMQAMDNATNNAQEMIDSLTLLYNRARQGSITQELTEIIAGAEAIS